MRCFGSSHKRVIIAVSPMWYRDETLGVNLQITHRLTHGAVS